MKIALPLRLLLQLLTCGFFLTFASCSPGGDPALIGKWKVKDSDHVVEIRKNGNWVESIGKDSSRLFHDYQVTSSTWEWEGTNRIRLTFNSKLVGKASGT